MEWIFLEALVALAAGIAIVWWTMSPMRKRERRDERGKQAESAADTADRGDGNG